MKKLLPAVLMLTALAGCTWYQTDYTQENAENRAIKKSIEGCRMDDDHAAYRECLIQTQLKNSPKTYTTSELPNGEPLAIIRGAQVKETEKEITVVIEKVEILTPTATEEVEVKEEVITPMPQQPAPKPQPQPVVEKTWWETYQANKPLPQQVQCSCDDPNVSCPQCYEK